MIVKQKIRNGWKLLREQGDISNIRAKSLEMQKLGLGKSLSRPTISSALNNGRMNEATYEIINSFYNSKNELRESLMNKSKTAFVEDDLN